MVGTALLVWLLAGVLSLLGGLTYGELGAMKPEAGGLYAYIRDAFGPLPAFLFGWTQFFVISSGSVATLAVAFTAYLNVLVPLTPLTARAAAVTMIVVIAGVNVWGTRNSAHVQNWTTGFKAGAILVLGTALIAFGRGFEGGGVAVWPETFGLHVLSGVGLAMIGVLWAYEGWHYVTFSAGEAIDPQRSFPRAIFFGTSTLIVLYLLANIGYVVALGPEAVAASDSVAADAVRALFGPGAGVVITVVILVSMFSAANGITLTAPRVYFAMARDRLFFRRLSEVHPRFGTPAVAVLASSAWAILLATTGTFEQLITYVVFVGWIFYGLGAMSIFVFRRRYPDAPRPFRVPGYPWTPLLFVVAAGAIVLNTLVAQPGRALLGIAVVLLGTPAYYLWRRSSESIPAR
jgi:basic amino acid/polyamine antiporter, APA family